MDKSGLRAAGILFVVTLVCPGAFAQDSQAAPSQKAQPDTAKKAKVWTDDNIDSVRTPSDVYQDQQAQVTEAHQAAQEKANAEAKLPSPSSMFAKPTTVKQADQSLAKAQSDLKSNQDFVAQSQKELATASGAYKQKLAWMIQYRTSVIQGLQKDIATLQKDRDALVKQPAGSGSSGNNTGNSAQ